MREISVGFSSRKGFAPYSWAIRAYEQTPFSHVYFRIGTKWKTELIYQASGSMVNFMAGAVFDDLNKVHREFSFKVSDEAYDNFMGWATTVCGKPYSAFQPFGIMLREVFGLKKNPFSNGQKAWVCSELVSFALSDSLGVHLSPHIFENATPRDLFSICLQLQAEVKDGDISKH